MASDSTTTVTSISPRPGLSLRAKIWIGFGGLLLILLLASVTSVVTLNRYSRAFEKVFHENYDSVIYCQRMKQALDGLNGKALARLWNSSADGHESVVRWEEQFAENIDHQRRNCFLPHEQEKSDAIGANWQRYHADFEQFISVTQVDQRRTAYTDMILPEDRQLRLAIDDVMEMNLRNMAEVDGQVRSTLAAVRNALLVLAAAGSLLALVFVGVFGPSMLRPLSGLTRSARQIADGQLDLSVEVPSHDEVGQLAEAFNIMAQRLREARERDRERLIRTEQTTQMAIDSLPDAVVVLGSDGGIELTNRAANDLFGFSPHDDLASHPWLTSLHAQVLESGRRHQPDGYRTAIQKFRDGEEHFFLPHAVPLLNGQGRAIGVTVVLADVTRLKQADEAKSNLVSTVSHELRTPLTSIRMAAHMLAEETFGPLTLKQSELLKTACDNSNRLHRILEDLLGISRIEYGRAPLKLEPIPAAEIISNALASLRTGFVDAGIELCDASDPSGALVLADPSCVGHVLTNLLSNAMKHTRRDGKVTVTFRDVADHVTFTVADNGPGIAPEHVPHVFEKFYRAATAHAPAGAGLGLAIAKEIVEAHGGNIWVKSEHGQGSSFAFTLRRA